MNNNKTLNMVMWAAMGMLSAGSSVAAEGVDFGGPVGGSDIGSAYLPEASGFYGGVVAGYAQGSKFYGDDARENKDIDISNKSGVTAVGLLYVYPFKLFGGTLGSTAQLSYASGKIDLNGTSERYKGTGDIYSDLLIWSKYLGDADVKSGALPTGLTVSAAYSMLFGVGTYDKDKIVSTGRNVTYMIPNAAVSYLTGPNWLGDGTEFSARVFLDIATENKATNYKNGPVADIDFAVSERMGKWQVGVAGYYAKQLSDDERDGDKIPGGNRFGSAGIGPVVSYTIPKWKSNVKFKLLAPVYSKNTMAQTAAYVVFSKAFD